ncbi:MAG: tRNA uridine-5-carboxymethylaminomethyl(34) synthesis GTPase MnmE [Bacteroidales bacterium]|nr:tRNA uridine-5-carboxymethylaminomethyl(34) synthesis GTPase MnmE [Bacteroidales bacterium]MBN2819490.1 tRNA uridine-5-carboxymethylaminomethyl(34) synthesis GTPase MnmE [Bacteroidales bacterium]
MHIPEPICAISTAPGAGAVAMIRLSGEEALQIADRVISFPTRIKTVSNQPANTIHFAKVIDGDTLIDEAMVAVFHAPHSYTGENTVEITCHGSVYIQQKILECLIKNGARLAKPGEFTQRAFLNGKLDLSQAEGVADLIASGSEAAHRLAITQMKGGFSKEISNLREKLLHFISLIELEIDFSEEDVEFADREKLYQLLDKIERLLRKLIRSFDYGNVIKSGIPVAIVGRTNAGKSTLLNQLLGEEKAIVSEIEGTTRDFIEDTMVLQGITFRFIDTAGLRKTSDSIETLGIERSVKKYSEAAIVIILIDAKDRLDEIIKSLEIFKDIPKENKYIIFAINKIDSVINSEMLISDLKQKIGLKGDYISLSAKFGTHIELLEEKLVGFALSKKPHDSDIVVTNVRHFEALDKAHQAIVRVINSLDDGITTDLLAVDIRESLHYLGEIVGEVTTNEILGNIFSKFCIGK